MKTEDDRLDDAEATVQSDSDSGSAEAPPGMKASSEAEAVQPDVPAGDGAIAERPEEAAIRLRNELQELKDRHLRLAAEFENFRKRTSRERTETWSRAQADVVSNILDALDDFGRVLDVDTTSATADDVVKGVELVERKLIRELVNAGLEKVGDPGEVFDPNNHEAIGSLPAEMPEQDQTVGHVVQVGYRFGGALLRPAKVQVRMWQEDGGG